MGEVVNLRRERKRKARELDAADAAQNRVAFGLPKATRKLAEARRALGERALDGRRLEDATRPVADEP